MTSENNGMVVRSGHAPALAPMEFSEEQRRMIRSLYAHDATEAEFAVLMEIAKARRLNPLLRQVHFVSRYDSNKSRTVWATQVSIDGLRAIAERTGLYAGQDKPEFTERPDGTIISCEVRVYRKDWPRPAVGVAYWSEYVQTFRDRASGKQVPSSFWARMPHTMISKCAEALALRKAFPEDTSGLYADDEMDQAGNDVPEPVYQRGPEKFDEPAAQIAPPADPVAQEPARDDVEVIAVEATAAGSVVTQPATPADVETAQAPAAEIPAALAVFAEGLSGVDLPEQGVDHWLKHRAALAPLSGAERETAWKALCARVELVGKMKNAKVWLKRAIAEREALSAANTDQGEPEKDPPPAGGGGGASNGGGGRTAARGGSAKAASTAGTVRALLSEEDVCARPRAFAELIHRYESAGHVAGAYWKRRESFIAFGVEGEAFEVACEELTNRGMQNASAFIQGVGVKNGYVQVSPLARAA